MLSSITLENFRTFRAPTEIPLRGVSVFIGPNNSGKTNAIRGIQLLASAAGKGAWLEGFEAHDSDKPFTVSGVARFSPQVELQLSLTGPTVELWNGRGRVQCRGDIDFAAAYDGQQSSWRTFKGERSARNGADFLRGAVDFAKECWPQFLASAPDFFRGVRVASLSAASLRKPAPVQKEPELGERGENFGAVLDWIKGERPLLETAINNELREVLGVDRFTTRVTRESEKIAAIVEGAQSYGADAVSDGVLLYLGMTTVAQLVGPKSLLVIEEPENGIHPRRLRSFLEQVRRTAAQGTQVILTTHSPVLLDEFRDDPRAVVVFERDQGGTRVRQLTDEDARQVENGDIGLGDLWFSGAIGGVPA